MATNLVPIRSAQQQPQPLTFGGARIQQRQLPTANVYMIGQGLSPVRRMSMPNGDRGTEFTIAKIRELVHAGMTDQLINRQATAIVHAAGVQSFDFVGEIRAVFDWVRRNIRFFKDVDGVETLRTAREVLTIRGGDCDDINAVLLSSLLLTIGHNVRLVTISSDAEAPGVFSHIYCEVEFPDGTWIPLDAARRDPAFGKGPRSYFRKRIWSLSENRFRDVAGLAGYFALPRSRNGHMRRLGDFTDILDSIAPVIQSAGTAAANIITATNTGIRANIPGFAVNPATGQLVPVGPNGQLVVSSAPGGVVASGSGSIPNWMLYGGALLGGLLLFKAVGK